MKFNSTSAAPYHLDMTDAIGRTIFAKDVIAAEDFSLVELDLRNLAKGVYMLHLSNGSGSELLRLVIA